MDELCDGCSEMKREKAVSLILFQALSNCTLLMKLLKHSFISTATKLVFFQLKHNVTTKQLSIIGFFGK